MSSRDRRILKLRKRVLKNSKPVEVKETILNELTVAELKDEAKDKGIKGYSSMTKKELVEVLEGD